ncbi:MAG TPA: hypothetical protein VES65_07880 [Solirubrobacteraceae bacterium]|nr:hypothetical protein [Solirubrobacteraceae bacterium]
MDGPHVVESISRGDWEQREVYAKFGLAIYFCQCLESQVVNYVIALRGAAGSVTTRQEVDALFGELFGNTLGRNLRHAVRILGDDKILLDELEPVLRLRNELVHHWMRERALDQGTSNKRRAMVEELDAAIEQLQAADAKLVERTQRLLEQIGVSRVAIEKEHERLSRIAESDGAENVMQDFEVVTKARRR